MAAIMGLVAGCSGDEPFDKPEGNGQAVEHALGFKDVTQEAGLGDFRHSTGAQGEKWFPESMGSGGGFLDYDGDGWEDIVLARGGSWEEGGSKEPVLWLYRNNGDGAFTQVTQEAGLGEARAYGLGVAAADYDNDGDQDLYLTTLERNLLFRNEGGRFTEVGEQAGIAEESAWSSSAIFFDADRDGDLDLYSGNYVKWSPETDLFCSLDGTTKGYCTPEAYQGLPSRYFVNNGDGTFTDATEQAGFLPAPGKTLGVSEADFNRDGWPDLVVANDTQPNLLYENNGDGTFTEKGAVSGMAYDENGRARAGMGIDIGVVDPSGYETIFVGNFSKEMTSVYRYGEGGVFTDRAATSKIGRTSLMTLTFGLLLFDADLDGDLDLFSANGHVQPEIETTQDGIGYAQPPHLFLNDGTGHFDDVAPQIGGALAQAYVARGAAYADYDKDGDVDLLLTTNDGPAHLLRNELRGASSGERDASARVLRVRAVGRQSPRDGLGTRVVVVAGGKRQEHRIRSGSSYLATSEKVATFGLASAEKVDSLYVFWPAGGVDRHADIPADSEVTVREGSASVAVQPLRKSPVVASAK